MKKWISALSVYGDKPLYAFLAWFIAGVLLLAVITKLLDPLDFYKIIIQHFFVPEVFARPTTPLEVTLELLNIYLLCFIYNLSKARFIIRCTTNPKHAQSIIDKKIFIY